ncbi:MAG: OsmC family protein [Ignavibacteriaceae bacterium]|nr:OsmC family protein [Ignavibacteriaceae bacterium]
MEETHYYHTSVTWKHDRIGQIDAPVMPPIEVATPPEFPKGVPNIWSPEHLFVASANICLMTTFLSIAENSKFDFISYKANATGKLEKVDRTFMISEITLEPEILVDSLDKVEKAERLIQKSEQHCLISNSMKTKIILQPRIIVKG